MIDLTPLDVRKKKGDFSRQMRGYDPDEVDHFLDMVAERLEEVVKANLTLEERVERLGERVQGQEGRERAVQEALVTAQSLKHDIQEQARREADLIRREAESAAQNVRDEIKRILLERRRELVELNRARSRFLKSFRNLLERELDTLDVEEANPPADEFDLEGLGVPEDVLEPDEESVPFRLSLGGWRKGPRDSEAPTGRETGTDAGSGDDPEGELEEQAERTVDEHEHRAAGDGIDIETEDAQESTEAPLELVPEGEHDASEGSEAEGEESDEGRWGRHR